MGLPEHQEVSIEISATQEKVYDLVSDVSRMGEWTGEAVGPAVAARGFSEVIVFWAVRQI